MAKRAKFKVAVGDNVRGSYVWTYAINRNDVYLSSAGSKNDKISLHESGLGSWSIRSEAASTARFLPAGGRHISRWKAVDPMPGALRPLHFIVVPDSELRSGRDVSGAGIRIPAPGPGNAVHIALAESVELDPSIERMTIAMDPSFELLFHHQLPNRKMVVAVARVTPVTDAFTATLDRIRSIAWEAAVAVGENPVGTRGSAVLEDPKGVTGFVEVAPYTGIFG